MYLRLQMSLAVIFGSFTLGLFVAIQGPTLMDLIDLLHINNDIMSYSLAFSNLAYSIGGLLSGLLFDYVNRQILTAVYFFIFGLANAATPFITNYTLFSIVIVFKMMCAGGTDCAANVLILDMWPGQDSWLQALHFAFACGCALGPLIVEPFLGVDYNKENEIDKIAGKTSGSTIISDQNGESRIYIPYSFSGAASCLAACYFVFLYYLNERHKKRELLKLNAKQQAAAGECILLTSVQHPAAIEAGLVGSAASGSVLKEVQEEGEEEEEEEDEEEEEEEERKHLNKQKDDDIDNQNIINSNKDNNNKTTTTPLTTSSQTQQSETSQSKATSQTQQAPAHIAILINSNKGNSPSGPPQQVDTSGTQNNNNNNTPTQQSDNLNSSQTDQQQQQQQQLLSNSSNSPPPPPTKPPKITSKARKEQIEGNKRPPYYVMFAIALAALSLSFYCGIEITSMNYLATFAVNIDLQLPKSTAAYMSSALTISFAVGRGFGIWLAAHVKPHKLFYLCAAIMATGNLLMFVFANTAEVLLWYSICLFGIGCGPMFPAIVSFYDDKIAKVTNTVSGIFILGSMFNVALNTLIIGHHIIDNALILIICNLIGSVVLLLLFGTLHLLTKVKTKQRVRKYKLKQQQQLLQEQQQQNQNQTQIQTQNQNQTTTTQTSHTDEDNHDDNHRTAATAAAAQ